MAKEMHCYSYCYAVRKAIQDVKTTSSGIPVNLDQRYGVTLSTLREILAMGGLSIQYRIDILLPAQSPF
jgi:hypothetical protein